MNAPPPPPHGTSSGGRNGLPEGSYDIFVVPPHSSGGGFIYFPSLQTNRNSFLAGVVCTLFAVMVWTIVLPVVKEWVASVSKGGDFSIIILLLAVGVAGWAWGKTQLETGGKGPDHAGGRPQPQPHAHPQPQPTPQAEPGPTPGFTPGFNPHAQPRPEPRPSPTWQRSTAGATPGASAAGAAKGGWEKAREETRKKEEERKRAEELRKKREEDEKERVRQREKDAREREVREGRERREKEARERREKEARERREKEARERREKEATASAAKPASRPASPSKNHRHPTAKTATDEASSYSYRPYDNPSRHGPKTATASSIYSESSYTPSQSTARTTPPPSHRGPYRNKDPDKITIKAVYSFNNVFTKTPVAKLVSGMGSVTDGLILRITTEGLFIDDDVRGVPQREWDVKAWTLKLVEVWCPHLLEMGASSGSNPAMRATPTGIFFGRNWTTKTPNAADSDSLLESLTRACKPAASHSRSRSDTTATSQSAEVKGLHVLRANIRDAEGKRYVFVISEEEGWKVAVGLQRLRRGTQVRALGVSGLPLNEAKALLENMGFT